MSLSYAFYLIPHFHPLLANTYNIYTARKVIPLQSYLRFILYYGSADGDNPDFLLLRGLHIEAAILGIYLGVGYLLNAGRGRFLVFRDIWLPFMILPVQAALERLPPSLLQASADLGARPRQTFRYVVLPLAIPGIAAGSIFTFSLTLGDFIVPQLVGPPGYFIGNMVYSQQGAIGNMPMAAAFTLVPIVLIALYLAFVKRLGAFDAL